MVNLVVAVEVAVGSESSECIRDEPGFHSMDKRSLAAVQKENNKRVTNFNQALDKEGSSWKKKIWRRKQAAFSIDLQIYICKFGCLWNRNKKILTQVSSVEIFEFTALSHVTVCASVNRERRKPFINLFCT